MPLHFRLVPPHFVCSGDGTDHVSSKFVKDYEIFDNTWKRASCFAMPQSYLAAITVGKKVYLISGYKENTTLVYSGHSAKCKIECGYTTTFCPKTGLWERIKLLACSRAVFGCTVLSAVIYVKLYIVRNPNTNQCFCISTCQGCDRSRLSY